MEHKELAVSSKNLSKNGSALPGFNTRFVAQLIDSSLSLFLTAILLLPPVMFFDVTFSQLIVSFLRMAEHPLYDVRITYAFSAYLIVIIYAWVKFQTTPGKRLMSLRIVQFENRQPPTKKQFALRSIGYVIAAIPFGLGYLWIIFDKDKRGLHDYMSGTQVIFSTGG